MAATEIAVLMDGAGKKSEKHEFEEVIASLRRLRSRGYFGTIAPTFRGHDVVNVKQDHSIKPGEPLP